MARYVVHVHASKTVEEAFTYMADLTNFARWDPGVISAKQVQGDGPELGAAYDVEVKAFPQPLTLRYHLTTFDEPNRVVARAESKLLTSLDTILVRPDEGDGSIVTYDAELTLNRPFSLADPLLGKVFDTIGDRAAKGLIRALNGTRVEEPA